MALAPLQAWDVIADPSLVPQGARVAIIGGGIVGLEVADVLSLRGCAGSVLEIGPAIAPAMARNNRTDLMIRLRERGWDFRTRVQMEGLADGTPQAPPADAVIAAVGALPNRDILPAVAATGIPHTLVGDCNQPGDFLSGLRDAWMTGLAIGMPIREGQRP